MNKHWDKVGLSQAFNSISVTFEKSTWSNMLEFLRTHEEDIASNKDNFELLTGAYRSFVGGYPQTKEEKEEQIQ